MVAQVLAWAANVHARNSACFQGVLREEIACGANVFLFSVGTACQHFLNRGGRPSEGASGGALPGRSKTLGLGRAVPGLSTVSYSPLAGQGSAMNGPLQARVRAASAGQVCRFSSKVE